MLEFLVHCLVCAVVGSAAGRAVDLARRVVRRRGRHAPRALRLAAPADALPGSAPALNSHRVPGGASAVVSAWSRLLRDPPEAPTRSTAPCTRLRYGAAPPIRGSIAGDPGHPDRACDACGGRSFWIASRRYSVPFSATLTPDGGPGRSRTPPRSTRSPPRREGGLVEAACARHADTAIRAFAACCYCGGPRPSLVVDGVLAHESCHSAAEE